MNMLNNCPVCKNTISKKDIDYFDIHWADTHFFRQLKLKVCNECGFGFSFPELSNEDTDNFYKNYYRRRNSVFYTDYSKLIRPKNLDNRSLSQILLAKNFVDFKKGDAFLDIGPGNGQSFNVANNVLDEPINYAIEPHEDAITAFHRIYSMQTFESIHEFEKLNIKAKIILLSHSLEHLNVSQLSLTINSFKKILDPKGALIIEVPHVDLRIHALFRREDSPHFLFFSKDSLRIYFKTNGWDILFIDTCSDFYADWWRENVSFISQQNSAIKLKNILKKACISAIDMLPNAIQHFIVRLFAKQINFKSSNFSYGENRTCLRLVARPCFS
jgi:hypothetical protein